MGNTANRILLTDYLLGQQASGSLGRNYVINPSSFLNTTNVAASGTATVARNTSTPLTQISDFSITLPNNATDGITWTLNNLDASVKGQNCEMRFDYTSSSIGSVVVAQVLQGANVVSQTTLVAASTSKPISLNSPCGDLSSSTTLKITNTTGNSGTSAMNVANVIYGKATNLSNISQSTYVGSAITPLTASCTWTTSAGYATFSTVSACPVPTVTGNLSAPATKIPAVVYNNAPPGEYYITAMGDFYAFNNINNHSFRFFDGTNSGGDGMVQEDGTASGASHSPSIVGHFSYSSAGNRTWEIQASTGASSSAKVDAATFVGLTIRVYYFPSSSGTAITANTTPGDYSGYQTVSGGCSTASATYADTSACTSIALTQQVNQNFGSITTAGSSLPGITFTPTSIGNYMVCASGTVSNSLAGTLSIRMVDSNSFVINQGASVTTTAAGDAQFSLCGLEPITSLAATTVKLQLATGLGTASIVNGTASGSSAIEWSIFNVSSGVSAPILVGSVTSGSSGAGRIETMGFGSTSTFLSCTTSTCPYLTQSSSWVTSVTRVSSGRYTVNFTAGTFSSAPTCTFTPNTNGGGTASTGTIVGAPTTAGVTLLIVDFSNSGLDGSGHVICMGPR